MTKQDKYNTVNLVDRIKNPKKRMKSLKQQIKRHKWNTDKIIIQERIIWKKDYHRLRLLNRVRRGLKKAERQRLKRDRIEARNILDEVYNRMNERQKAVFKKSKTDYTIQ